MKKIFAVCILIGAPIFISTVLGQAPPPPPGPLCWPPPCAIPLDGGISFLIAAGVGYGAKKLYDNSKKNPF